MTLTRRSVLVLATLLAGCKGCKLPAPHHGPVTFSAQSLGDGWTLETLSGMNRVLAVSGTSGSDVWAVGSGLFHFDGKTWSDATPPSFGCSLCTLRSVSAVAPDDVWAVGDDGFVAHWDGSSWTLSHPAVLAKPGFKDTYEDLVHVVAWKDEVWALLSFGQGFVRFDKSSWTRMPWPDHDLRDTFFGVGPKDVWIPGESARHWDGSWTTAETFGMTEQMYAAHGSAPDDVWMVGSGNSKGTVGAARHFDGKSWSADFPLPYDVRALYAVHVVSRDEAWAGGLGETLVRWNGSEWKKVALPSGARGTFKSIYAPGGGAVFVAGVLGDDGVLYKK